MDFSERLKALRKKKGLTQEELAKRLFISRSVIAKYECGKSLPTRENAEKLAAFFDIKLSDLIEEEQVRMRSSEFRMRKNIAYILSFTGIFIDAFLFDSFLHSCFFQAGICLSDSGRFRSAFVCLGIKQHSDGHLEKRQPDRNTDFRLLRRGSSFAPLSTDCASAEENRFKTGICFRVAARHRCFSDFSDDCAIGVVCFVGRCGF